MYILIIENVAEKCTTAVGKRSCKARTPSFLTCHEYILSLCQIAKVAPLRTCTVQMHVSNTLLPAARGRLACQTASEFSYSSARRRQSQEVEEDADSLDMDREQAPGTASK